MWRASSDPLKHAEAVAWFRARVPMLKADWLKLAETERRRAFTVAAVTELSVLEDVFGEIKAGQELGESLGQIKKRIKGKLEAAWSGTLKRPSHRVETIIRNAHQSAYNAGRYMQMTSTAVMRARPYWQFDAVVDGATSEICLERDQQIRPASDLFWTWNYPPLHHRCRSAIRTLTEAEALARGVAHIHARPETTPGQGFGRVPDRVSLAPDLSKVDPDLGRVYRQKLGQKEAGIGEALRPWVEREARKTAAEIRSELEALARAYDERIAALKAAQQGARAEYTAALESYTRERSGQLLAESMAKAERAEAVSKELRAVMEERTLATRELVFSKDENDQRIKRGPGLGSSRDAGLKAGLAAYRRMVSPSWRSPEIEIVGTRSKRSFARPERREVHLEAKVSSRTVVHELAHVLEGQNEEIKRAAVAFFERRTRGEVEVALAKLYPRAGYSRSERTKPDAFVHPYVGKIYKTSRGDVRATEVVSMGLERMYADPLEFARADPEHFELIWRIMGGPHYARDF